MASSTDQIQADIARTRARMSARLDQTGGNQSGSGTSLTTSIAETVRQRPLVALGLSLIAGSILQDYLSGQSGGASSGYTSATRPAGPAYRGSVGTTNYSAGYSAGSAGQRAGSAVQQAVDTTRDAASGVVDATTSAVKSVANTAGDAVGQVVETTGDVVGGVVNTAGDVAEGVYDTVGNVAEGVYDTASDLGSTISAQISRQPLLALGLSLAAGAFLQNYLRGRPAGTSIVPAASYRPYNPSYGGYTPSYATATGSTVRQGANRAAGSVGQATSNAARTVGDVAGTAVDTVGDVASSAAGVVGDVTSTVVDTAQDVASATGYAVGQVADTAGDVAGYVADTAGDAAGYVADTAGDVYETVGDLLPTIGRQIQQRPLTALGVAIAAGMWLQPTLAPHVSSVTSDVGGVMRTAGGAMSLPEPLEVQRIRTALVPATLERAKHLTTHQLRDYLEQSLEGVMGQTSLRAGVVAAITEKAETLVENRLPGVLNNLQGTSSLVALGLAGALLQAYDQAKQGQGSTVEIAKNGFSQSILQTARDQLLRYFPEFREQFQAAGEGGRRCSNCGSEVAANARFCATCGMQQV